MKKPAEKRGASRGPVGRRGMLNILRAVAKPVRKTLNSTVGGGADGKVLYMPYSRV